MGLKFLKFFSGFPSIFWEISKFLCNKWRQKLENIVFLNIFGQLFELYQKMSILNKKTAVRGAISQKEGIEILQDAPHIEAFWNPDQLVSSAFMEMKVTLEEGCAGAAPCSLVLPGGH